MFRTYFKVAVRNLMQNRVYAALNILGLAVGIACCIVIFLYLQSELSYDAHYKNSDRIYRLGSAFTMHGEEERLAISSPTMGRMLQAEYPDIETVCRMRYVPRVLLKTPLAAHYDEDLLLADSTYFQLFNHDVLSGHPENALMDKKRIVLTESLARKLFGAQNPVGDSLRVSNREYYRVSAVIADLPENTHHKFSGLISYHTMKEDNFGDRPDLKVSLWSAGNFTFIKVRPGFTEASFYAWYPEFYARHMAEIGKLIKATWVPLLERLRDVHTNPKLLADRFASGNRSYIWGFTAIGFFILILACINYMNMATARSATRAREVGLRKVMGASRSQLILQFLGESVLIALLALLLAFGIVEVALELTPFNDLLQKKLELDLIGNPFVVMVSFGLTLLLGILSGMYPALHLSSFVPARALRSRSVKGGMSGTYFRKGLVLFQFSVSIGVIICTFLMRNQVEYMRNVDLGFAHENTLVVPVNDSITLAALPEIRQRLQAEKGVIATTTANHVPGHGVGMMVFRLDSGCNATDEPLHYMEVGYDYPQAMGIEIVEGRHFRPGEFTDSTCAFVINEAAVRQFFGGKSPLGKTISWGLGLGSLPMRTGPVVGVMRDFNVQSLHYQIRPLVLLPMRETGGLLHIRFSGATVRDTYEQVEKIWQPYEANGSPFNAFFINDKLDRLYEEDQRLGTLMGILAYICVMISILGLLGFASFTVEQRKREIGIRKVLGASLPQLIVVLMREILFLILAASMMGSTAAYLVIDAWLGDYAYHAPIPVTTFFAAGLVSLAVALIAVSYHAVRAALASPVYALKYE